MRHKEWNVNLLSHYHKTLRKFKIEQKKKMHRIVTLRFQSQLISCSHLTIYIDILLLRPIHMYTNGLCASIHLTGV